MLKRSEDMVEAELDRRAHVEQAWDFVINARDGLNIHDAGWHEFYVEHAIRNLMIGSHVGRIGA